MSTLRGPLFPRPHEHRASKGLRCHGCSAGVHAGCTYKTFPVSRDGRHGFVRLCESCSLDWPLINEVVIFAIDHVDEDDYSEESWP